MELEKWSKNQKWYKNFTNWLPKIFVVQKLPDRKRLEVKESKETRYIDDERLRS